MIDKIDLRCVRFCTSLLMEHDTLPPTTFPHKKRKKKQKKKRKQKYKKGDSTTVFALMLRKFHYFQIPKHKKERAS